MPLSFHCKLQDSSLSVDWPMIVVGWRGFSSHKLSAEQVTSFALELIGRGTPEQDEIAALLANTDPSEWQTIDRYLNQVAEPETFDKNIALRRWRLIELRSLIATTLSLDDVEGEEDGYSIFYTFVDFWQDYDELPDSRTMIPDWGTSAKELILRQQAWAEQEEVFLRSNTEANR